MATAVFREDSFQRERAFTLWVEAKRAGSEMGLEDVLAFLLDTPAKVPEPAAKATESSSGSPVYPQSGTERKTVPPAWLHNVRDCGNYTPEQIAYRVGYWYGQYDALNGIPFDASETRIMP